MQHLCMFSVEVKDSALMLLVSQWKDIWPEKYPQILNMHYL